MNHSIEGFYGVNKTPCSINVVPVGLSGFAYCIEGSQRIHLTWESLEDEVWLQEVEDYDFFETNGLPIWDSEILLLILEEIGL